jgi:hypothetical protein
MFPNFHFIIPSFNTHLFPNFNSQSPRPGCLKRYLQKKKRTLAKCSLNSDHNSNPISYSSPKSRPNPTKKNISFFFEN